MQLMRQVVNLSIKDARKYFLHSQSLNRVSTSPVQVLEHLGYVQIDTISVVERAHHHIFWSRLPKYRSTDLDELVESRQAFEYWSHAAAYLPMRDYRFTLLRKKAFKKRVNEWWPKDPKLMRRVLDRIKAEGPLQSRDFENPRGSSNGWWQWKPAKKALERLFMEGRLEITRRKGFQKVFDLTERVIPASVDTKLPSENEYAEYLINRTLRHHGLATVTEMTHLGGGPLKARAAKQAEKMWNAGTLVAVDVEGSSQKYFANTELFETSAPRNRRVVILSPFDNSVIQRKKLSDLYGFDYQIECYVPAKKRKFGYLPCRFLSTNSL